jgi:hypothetical protein
MKIFYDNEAQRLASIRSHTAYILRVLREDAEAMLRLPAKGNAFAHGRVDAYERAISLLSLIQGSLDAPIIDPDADADDEVEPDWAPDAGL